MGLSKHGGWMGAYYTIKAEPEYLATPWSLTSTASIVRVDPDWPLLDIIGVLEIIGVLPLAARSGPACVGVCGAVGCTRLWWKSNYTLLVASCRHALHRFPVNIRGLLEGAAEGCDLATLQVGGGLCLRCLR